MKRTFLLAASMYAFFTCIAQNDFGKEISVINKDCAKGHISFLASDLLKGRDAGREGGWIASEFIASQLKEYGIESFGENYFQPFNAIVIPREEKRPLYITQPEEIEKRKSESREFLKMRNILAKIDGENKDEFVIIGAHYDHLGIGKPIDNDSIFNGADDNASGVTAVLQIAKAIKEKGVKPRRTIIFAFWDGEERGLLGSTRFVDDFPERNKIKGYINFDMIGRNSDEASPNHVDYFFTEAYPLFGDWLRNQVSEIGLQLNPTYRPWDKPIGGSDNASFAKYEIPIIWYHTNGHPDYHQVSDHEDKINYDKLVQMARSACLNIWNMANQDF